MAAKLDLRPAGAWTAEQEARQGLRQAARTAPGPALRACCECGASAPYATGDFGRLSDTPEFWCSKHWHLAPLPKALLP